MPSTLAVESTTVRTLSICKADFIDFSLIHFHPEKFFFLTNVRMTTELTLSLALVNDNLTCNEIELLRCSGLSGSIESDAS